MLRKKQTPAPNKTDRFFYHVWKKIGYYTPLVAVLSVFDWGSDLFGTSSLWDTRTARFVCSA